MPTKAELTTEAESKGIDVMPLWTKADIIEAIESHKPTPRRIKALDTFTVPESPFHGRKAWHVKRGQVFSAAHAAYLWDAYGEDKFKVIG